MDMDVYAYIKCLENVMRMKETPPKGVYPRIYNQ